MLIAICRKLTSEAYGGYHWDTWNGVNLDAGIFMSYIGLFSYYNFDNWVTLDYMPDQFATFRVELDHHVANVPYFAGSGGVTPPGGNTGPAGSAVAGFTPDLRTSETRVNLALLVRL
jgi:hypothetical protein